MQLFRRLHNWLFGTWFRITSSDSKVLEVRRGWEGSHWITARDDCYEISLQISLADADKIQSWLRDSRLTRMEKRRGLRIAEALPIPEAEKHTNRGPRSIK